MLAVQRNEDLCGEARRCDQGENCGAACAGSDSGVAGERLRGDMQRQRRAGLCDLAVGMRVTQRAKLKSDPSANSRIPQGTGLMTRNESLTPGCICHHMWASRFRWIARFSG